ncbi:MAG: hypothetical protein HON53_22105 [Planctomycetaceae bacterium]|jgi:hypothetical protein|nr:hypothetical protein [Planctomycetaceae bacterium]MBT6154799.1 hypothetical protein [Planctomycetaceae bacterium]MBT6486666.1 hypothetical protein [Planctomycetaceae bacterium]MBT6493349.1 hypothetical protein [Planctomycetaceae bacterium]
MYFSRRSFSALGVATLLLLVAEATWAEDAKSPDTAAAPLKVTKVPTELRERLELVDFYQKYVSANGFPILGSAKVSDYAMLEAGYLVNLMIAQRPDVREALIDSKSQLTVMAYNEMTTDVPEHSKMKPKKFWDRRARGLGGSPTDPVASCAEENLLCLEGDRYDTENILIHEFAHLMHLRGVIRVDKTFDGRLKQTYENAMQAGLWKSKYASNNKNEYWAEGVQSWFDNNRPPDHDHNHVNTRKELIEYDPGLARLCKEVFGDTVLRYVRPQDRKDKQHLTGFDWTKAPKFEWPKGLEEWYREYNAKKKANKK